MKRDEYEQRKQRLETQLREGISLLESAHRQQVRALELVWMTTAEEDLPFPTKPNESQGEPAAPAPPPEIPSRPRRRSAGELDGEVETALLSVPETFDRNDICRALGYAPDRGSLYRILQRLTQEGALTLRHRGSGKSPTIYKKTGTALSPPGL